MYPPQASMVVNDIPDLKSGLNLGSVVFSESFLESSICIQQRGKNLILDSVLLLMLKNCECDIKGHLLSCRWRSFLRQWFYCPHQISSSSCLLAGILNPFSLTCLHLFMFIHFLSATCKIRLKWNLTFLKTFLI